MQVWTWTYYSAEANTQMGRRTHHSTHFETQKWNIFLGRGRSSESTSNGEGCLYPCAFGTRLGLLQTQILDPALLVAVGREAVDYILDPDPDFKNIFSIAKLPRTYAKHQPQLEIFQLWGNPETKWLLSHCQ